jgi:hypothetical protein
MISIATFRFAASVFSIVYITLTFGQLALFDIDFILNYREDSELHNRHAFLNVSFNTHLFLFMSLASALLHYLNATARESRSNQLHLRVAFTGFSFNILCALIKATLFAVCLVNYHDNITDWTYFVRIIFDFSLYISWIATFVDSRVFDDDAESAKKNE